MPAPGHQHLGVGSRISFVDPHEGSLRQISAYTAQEIATLQSRLEKKLGPEYLSTRSGPSGQKVHYIAAEKCIQLANEVFGFNGWSSQIMDCQVDFVDENPQTLRVSLGLSVVVRVTLKDGTFHEDIGYGHIENCKGKAAAFEKSKKEGTTDALKRALRNFGNVLGNCIYDKEYLKQVSKVKPFVPKWTENDLFRHNSFVVPTIVRKLSSDKDPENVAMKNMERKDVESISIPSRNASEESFEDEFGDFDDADFSVAEPGCHPDEVVLSDSTPPTAPTHPNTNQNTNIARTDDQKSANLPQTKSVHAPSRVNVPSFQKNPIPQAPVTPRNSQGKFQDNSGPAMQTNINIQNRPAHQPPPANPIIANRTLNQPSRTNGGSSSNFPVATSTLSNKLPSKPPQENDPSDIPFSGVGFYSARAANLIPAPTGNMDGPPTRPPDPIPPNAPAFNPHAESPSIRKTPGVDHRTSKPLTRDLKHVPSGSQALASSVVQAGGLPRGNILNPSLDSTRRIGAPGSPSPMGMSNLRGTGFRMPMKRPTEIGGTKTSGNGSNRVPLETLNANGVMTDGVDTKRQKMHG